MQAPLFEAVTAYLKLQRRRFHVPGHAGVAFLGAANGLEPFGFTQALLQADLTELDGLDVLGWPEGCLLESQALCAQAFGVKASFYCTQGSTTALQAAMLATFQPGDEVLLPRNAHRAVVSAVVLAGLQPVWLLPPWLEDWGLWGGLSEPLVAAALAKNPAVKGLILTHPTYEGLSSEIEAIAKLCFSHNKRLIVDEAHGALWGFSNQLPSSATQAGQAFSGVDAVIQSAHKTVGSLTQTAWLHLPKGSSLLKERVQDCLNLLHTTSPSYPLLLSLEAAWVYLSSDAGKANLQSTLGLCNQFRQVAKGLNAFHLLEMPNQQADLSRFYLRHAAQAGEDWAAELEQTYALSYESATPYGALYLGQLGLTWADYEALLQGLQALESSVFHPLKPLPQPEFALPEQAMLPREAFFAPGQTVAQAQAVGRIAKQTVVRCPPGIPVLLPGEMIGAHHLPHCPPYLSVVR